MPNILNPGISLGVNESITSDDGRFTLILQGDGNLVLYYDINNNPRALWSTAQMAAQFHKQLCKVTGISFFMGLKAQSGILVPMEIQERG